MVVDKYPFERATLNQLIPSVSFHLLPCSMQLPSGTNGMLSASLVVNIADSFFDPSRLVWGCRKAGWVKLRKQRREFKGFGIEGAIQPRETEYSEGLVNFEALAYLSVFTCQRTLDFMKTPRSWTGQDPAEVLGRLNLLEALINWFTELSVLLK